MSKIVYTRETTNDDIGTVETFYEAQADELSGETLSPYFASSESVTKSLNQSGNIEFSVDADIVQKVERAILTPADTPSEDVVPVVDSTNAVSYKPLSEIGGGGGGLQTITFSTFSGLYDWLLANNDRLLKLNVSVMGGALSVFFGNLAKVGEPTPVFNAVTITTNNFTASGEAITMLELSVTTLTISDEAVIFTEGTTLNLSASGVTSTPMGGGMDITDFATYQVEIIITYN